MTTDYALVIDLEVDLGGDRKDPSPYNKDNSLVAIGYTYRQINGEPIWNRDGSVKILNVNTSNFTEFNYFKRALKMHLML